jgi:hypothetical protein
MSFQAVLTYTSLVGYQPINPTRLRVLNAQLEVAATAQALGFDVTGDATTAVGTTIERQITLTTNALGDRLWYTAAQVQAITTKLFRGALNMQIPSLVIASTPVVT